MTSHPFPFAAAGEMGARIRDHDWERTGLGAMAGWSPTLWSALGICLHSGFPAAIYWGDARHLLYNDAWRMLAGEDHPAALGRPADEVWTEHWPALSAELDDVRTRRCGVAIRDAPLRTAPCGTPLGGFWDYSLTPITTPEGDVAGILHQGHETTDRVHAAQHDALRIALADALRPPMPPHAILDAALPIIARAVGCERVGYAELDLNRGLSLVQHCWTDGSLPMLGGAHRLSDFRALEAAMYAGEPFVLEDIANDPRLDPAAHAWLAAKGVGSEAAVPLVRDGAGVVLFAHDLPQRKWPAHRQSLAAVGMAAIAQAIATARTNATLVDRAEHHRLVFEQAEAILFSVDADGRLTACNPAAARAFGQPVAMLVMQPLISLIPEADYARLVCALAAPPAGSATATVVIAIGRGDTPAAVWELTATPAHDRDGAITGFHAVARDVTAERAAARRQQLLIDELNHRVKNMLALVQGLALQTFRDGRSLGACRTAFQDRLGALAAAHDLLSQGHWEGAALTQVAERIVRDADARSGRIHIAGPPLTIAPKPAISLALALHELTANATAYGALSTEGGHVALDWDIDYDRLRLRWCEHDGPVPTPRARAGFGLRMIERVLAADFAGRVAIDFTPEGLVCTLDAPLPPALCDT